MSVIDATVAGIDEKLDAVRDEIRRLEGARVALAGRPRQTRRRQATTKAKTTKRRVQRVVEHHRKRPGQREAEFLAVVQAEPGITTKAVAEKCQMKDPQAYGIARRLAQRGTIEGNNKTGWRPTVRQLRRPD